MIILQTFKPHLSTYARKCIFLSPKFLIILRTLSLNQDFPLFNSFVTESRLDLRMKKYASLDVWCCDAAFNTIWTPSSQESSHVLCTRIAKDDIIIYAIWHQNKSHSLKQLSNPCNPTPTQTWSYSNYTSIDEKSSRQSYKLRRVCCCYLYWRSSPLSKNYAWSDQMTSDLICSMW